MEMKQPKKTPPDSQLGVPLTEKQITQGFRIPGGIDSTLTRLFNALCLDVTGGRGISPIQWNKLMNDHIRSIVESNTVLDRSSIRGNRNKELRRTNMTWLVFCKGLQFLKFEAFTISIEGSLSDGKEFNAYTSVSFVPNTRFAHLFPEEQYSGVNIARKEGKASLKPRAFVNGYRGALARLFNLICLDLTDGAWFSKDQWDNLLTTYIDETEGELEPEKKLNVRSGLNKEFRLPKITWKVFRKGLRFLQVRSFTLRIIAYRVDGLISECETTINFAPRT